MRVLYSGVDDCGLCLNGRDDLREKTEEEERSNPVETSVHLHDLPVGLGVVAHQHRGQSSPGRHLRPHHLHHLGGEGNLAGAVHRHHRGGVGRDVGREILDHLLPLLDAVLQGYLTNLRQVEHLDGRPTVLVWITGHAGFLLVDSSLRGEFRSFPSTKLWTSP